DRKSTRLNSSHANISYAVLCLKKKSRVGRRGGTGVGAQDARGARRAHRVVPPGCCRGSEGRDGHRQRLLLFFFNDPPTTEIYTLSLHDALPICFRARLLSEASGPVAKRTGFFGAAASS